MAGVRENLKFDYGNALIASAFSSLAYKHRDARFADIIKSTGWTPIGLSASELGYKGYSPSSIGYGVDDPLSISSSLPPQLSGTQSYGIAAKRELPDGGLQFLVGYEGSNTSPLERADWAQNAGRYGWSEHYTTLIPLFAKVLWQVLEAQANGKVVELIITGHSLGGAIAQTAFADLLAPQGNLWPGSNDILNETKRIYSTIGDWTEGARQQILDATSVYTFGAPSFLIEPNKLNSPEIIAFMAALPVLPSSLSLIAFLARTFTALTVNNARIPDLSAVNGISFSSSAFQFGHENSSWYYPGDIVAQLGSRQPGNVLDINLDDSIHKAYTSLLTRFLPGGTHPMDSYQESVIRLVTGNTILKDNNPLGSTSPLLPETTSNTGSDTANDRFINRSASGLKGNDLFIYRQANTSYTADGGADNDIYTVGDYGISLNLDGSNQSGRDTLIFDLSGERRIDYFDLDSNSINDKAVFSITNGAFTSSVTITNWDQWQIADIFQTSKPTDSRWSLIPWTDLSVGPGVDFSVDSDPLPTTPTAKTTPSKSYVELLVTTEAIGTEYEGQDLSLDELLVALRNPEKRDQFSIAITTIETDRPSKQSSASDTRFYRVARNRFALDAIVATAAGDDYANNLLLIMKMLAGEGGKLFKPTAAQLSLASDKALSIINNESTTTQDIVNLRSELVSRPSKSSILAFVALDASENPASLSITSLRARAEHLLSALDREDTTSLVAPLDQGTSLVLTEGERFAFFEVAGNSIANASGFTLIQPSVLNANTIELRTSLGMVVRLVGQTNGDAAGLAAFIARDQKHMPVFNLSGLKLTDTLTGQVVLAREADFNIDGGFYRIENMTGAVRDLISGDFILPGETGYTAAALAQSVGRLSNLRIADNASAAADFSLTGDALTLLAPFAKVNTGSTSNTYFVFERANPDGLAHFRTFGDNIFGLEDQLGGGDNDFDDLVVGFGNLNLG